MGLRDGRIDVFDSARGSYKAMKQFFKGKIKMHRLKNNMFIHLCKVANRVAKNAIQNAPDPSNDESDYYNKYVNFLMALNNDKKTKPKLKDGKLDELKKGNSNKLDSEKCDTKTIAAVNKFVSGPKSLKDKAIAMAKDRKSSGYPNPANGELDWLKVLTHGIDESGVSSALSDAKSKKSKLEKTNKAEKYKQAVQELDKIRKDLKKLKMKWFWLMRSAEENAEKNEDLAEGGGSTKDSTERDTKKYFKKSKKTRKGYTVHTTRAIDTLIDIKDSVDHENEKKIISPRDTRVFIQLSKLNLKDRRNTEVKDKQVIKELTKTYEKEASREQGGSDETSSRGRRRNTV